MNRRGFILGGAGLILTTPTIVRATSLDYVPRAISPSGWFRCEFIGMTDARGAEYSMEITGNIYKPSGTGWVPII